jgi:N-formylglutamate amidohydrolase
MVSGEENDAVLAELYAAPFRLARPTRQSVPFVFASPHAGRLYPPSFIDRSRLSAMSLRRSEDAYVEELFSPAIELGAPFLAARFPRAYLDANRAPTELDAMMFDGELTMPVDAPSARVAAGLGVIPRIVRDGAEIYREKLSLAEAELRLTRLYRPYHAALAQLVDDTMAQFGTCVVVDCHSMPSAAAIPEIVLGDRYGTAAVPSLMRRAEIAFESHAFTVQRNVPYAGGYTTYMYGKPSRGLHAIQIEINRASYLDEERIVPDTRFDDVRARVGAALGELTAIDHALLRPARNLPWAAE